MPVHRRLVLQSLASVAATGAGLSWAQKSMVTLMVGFPPSGLPDQVARALADPLGKAVGVPGVVDNRPGANGRIAAQAVKAAPPDGRTLLITPASGMVHLPHVYKNLGYDPFTDFAPVAQLVENDFAFTISPKVPVRTLAEFAAWARKNPDLATYGSPGQGSAPHFMGVQLARATESPLKHVPYKGNNFAINDLAGGHITSMFSSTTFVTQAHKAGTVRILATTGKKRLPAIPDVPTFAELGIERLSITEGTWLMAPAKTPPDLIAKLTAGAKAATESTEMKNLIQDQAALAYLAPADLARVMRQEFDKRGADVKASGFSVND